MKNLENLNITDIEKKVNSYYNLFYHRTVILEGIRKIAFRNMNHNERALEYCRNIVGDISIECIQAKILSDQGLDDNAAHREFVGWATFFPVQLYLALLYAEIECYEKLKNTFDVFFDNTLDSYLNSTGQFLDNLRDFRDGFLHPADHSQETEINFLQAQDGRSYYEAPTLQRHLDVYLANLRVKLYNLLFHELNQLTEIHRLHCLVRFRVMNAQSIKLYNDFIGLQLCMDEIKSFSQWEMTLPNEMQGWIPNARQKDIIDRIARCLDILHPSRQQLECVSPIPSLIGVIPEVQTPINGPIFSMLGNVFMHVTQTRKPIGSGRHITYLKNHVWGYLRLLLTSIILFNETIYGKEDLIDPSFYQQDTPISRKEFLELLQERVRMYGFQRLNESVAPSRVIAAMFYELMRVYKPIAQENPSLTNRRLDSFISSGKLRSLNLHRNSIFHILNPQKKSVRVDLMSTIPESENSNIFKDLFDGVLEFFAGIYGSKNS